MIAGIAVFTTAVAIHLPRSTSGSDIGVALSIILLTNTTLLRLVESWATLEISLGAISRLKQVNNETPREDQPWETLDCSDNWPSQGSIVIEKVFATDK
jgi:ATP-binding cassette subfamily C (CFTR/MRP) protein 1